MTVLVKPAIKMMQIPQNVGWLSSGEAKDGFLERRALARVRARTDSLTTLHMLG